MLARMDRQIPALQCIEAVRMYAAGHDGKLPASLAQLTELLRTPVLIDPVMAAPFPYKLVGDTAVLEMPVPPGEDAGDGGRYELTVAN